ncbi:MAG: SprT-like domain-containing protein [Pseudomonadota bacterium]
MRKVVYMLILTALTGCHYLPGLGGKKEIVREPVIAERVTAMSGRAFEVPERTTYTEREHLFRMIDELDLAYEALAFQKPYPLTRIAERSPHLGRNAQATAIITEDGKEILYIRRSYLNAGHPLRGLIRHEIAHFKTWRMYGTDVALHGFEFKSVCQRVTHYRECKAKVDTH